MSVVLKPKARLQKNAAVSYFIILYNNLLKLKEQHILKKLLQKTQVDEHFDLQKDRELNLV